MASPCVEQDDLPAYGALPGADVALAIVQAEVGLQITDAVARQPIDAQVAGIADTLSLPTPAIHQALGELIAGLELAGICLLT